MNLITSHILDTSSGKPAVGITTILFHGENDEWTEIARGASDSDGRITGLLNDKVKLIEGIYKLRFETKDYFDKYRTPTFYPYVEIIFEINPEEYYHIPLLLNPFGYTTYRGS